MLRLLARMTFLGARFDLRTRFGDLAQTLLAPRQFVGNRHPIGDVRRVRRLGFGHETGDFGLQLRLDLACMFIGKRAVPARVGMNFRTVEPDRTHLQHAHLACEQQHLNEQPLDLLEKAPPERRDCVVVGMIVGGNETKRHRVIRRPLQLAARKYARRITINQNAQQHSRMIRRRAGAAITAAHRAKVEPVDHLHNEASQMLLWQPLVNRRWQQEPGLPINRAEVAHPTEPIICENQWDDSIVGRHRPLSPTGC